MKIARFLVLIVIVMSWMSCGKRHVQIDRETRRMIDTVASKEIAAIRPQLDSICALKHDSLVTVMSDSILRTRREEIRKILGK